MSDGKITHVELGDIFGETIPVEAINLLFNVAPDTMTIGEIRVQLRAIGAKHKRTEGAYRAVMRVAGNYLGTHLAPESVERVARETAEAVLAVVDATEVQP